MLRRLRFWLIQKLAGDTAVALNLRHSGIHISGDGLIVNCEYVGHARVYPYVGHFAGRGSLDDLLMESTRNIPGKIALKIVGDVADEMVVKARDQGHR